MRSEFSFFVYLIGLSLIQWSHHSREGKSGNKILCKTKNEQKIVLMWFFGEIQWLVSLNTIFCLLLWQGVLSRDLEKVLAKTFKKCSNSKSAQKKFSIVQKKCFFRLKITVLVLYSKLAKNNKIYKYMYMYVQIAVYMY